MISHRNINKPFFCSRELPLANSRQRIFFFFLLSSLSFFFLSSFSQVEKKFIHEGNKNYSEGKYEDAEKNYQEALEKNAASFHGKFNKADALYRQQKFEEAAQQFGNLAAGTEDKNLKAQAYHNLGNAMLQSKKLKESVEAYKNALRNNPDDEDTRKNLAYAMSMLQQQQQQQQQDDKNENKEDKKQEQQQQNEKENEEKKDEKNQEEQQNEQKQEQQQKQKEQKKDQLSKQDAQRLLESMNNDEKKLQEKLKREKLQKVQPVEIEKDW